VGYFSIRAGNVSISPLRDKGMTINMMAVIREACVATQSLLIRFRISSAPGRVVE
jgi:hypothetical protein